METKLNSFNEYYMGFKIERNGQVFTLTDSEMEEFRKLESAQQAYINLELTDWLFENYTDEQKQKIEELKKDIEWLAELQNDIENIQHEDVQIECDIIENFVNKTLFED